MEQWLAAPAGRVAVETHRHADVLGGLVRRHRVTGPLVSDAHLAALAIEHGVGLCSTDADVARFDGLRRRDPLAPPAPDA